MRTVDFLFVSSFRILLLPVAVAFRAWCLVEISQVPDVFALKGVVQFPSV